MAELKGINLVVEFGETDISAMGRTADIQEAHGEPEKIDVTHRGDTARNYLEGFPGGANTTVTVTAIGSDDGSDPIAGLTMNTSAVLDIYPEGKTAGQDIVKLAAARLTDRTYTIPYDGAVEWTVSFNSVNSVTYSTYTTGE